MTLRGHDIAGVNGQAIITQALAAPDSFVITKAGEGLSYHDPLHAYFAGRVRAAAKLLGHYWYAWVMFDPVQCARNFVTFAGAKPGESLMLDFEEPYHSLARPASEWAAWIIAFTSEVTRLTGAPCWLYLNDDCAIRLISATSAADMAEIHKLPLVKAYYGLTPGDLHGWSTLTDWQCSDRGIDSDVFYGDAQTWAKLAIPQPTPVKPPAPKPVPKPKPKPTHAHNLVVTGRLNMETRKAMQRELKVTPDGIVGPVTRKALQRHLGVTPDGIVGPVTTKALQRHTANPHVDGVWPSLPYPTGESVYVAPHSETTRYLQTALNEGRF